MKYILMMHGQKASWDEYARWSKEDLQRNVEFMRHFSKELHDSGVFVDTKGLAGQRRRRSSARDMTESRLPTACFRNRRSSLLDTGLST